MKQKKQINEQHWIDIFYRLLNNCKFRGKCIEIKCNKMIEYLNKINDQNKIL